MIHRLSGKLGYIPLFLFGFLFVAIMIGSQGISGARGEEIFGQRSPGADEMMAAFEEDKQPPQNLNEIALTSCTGGSAGGYPCSNIDLMAFLPLSSIGGGNGNDIWGWTDSQTGKEYALMGRTSGTSFVDISDPENPVYLGNLPTHTFNSSWRDIKVYADHAFIVSEASGHGMQVFDLTQLRNVASPPVTFSNTAHYNNFGNAHNIVINEDSGFAYAVGTSTCSGGLHMVNIQNPTSPTSAGCVSNDGYVHDAQCVIYNGPDTAHQGREICFNSNEDTITIVDVTVKNSPVQLSRTGYSGRRYTHQGWLTEDHVYFLLDDELDEQNNGHNTRTYIWDMSNLDAPLLIGAHTATTAAIDHNQYIKGNYAYQSNYRAGLRILDISNISGASLTEVAYFDIYPANDNPNFNGSWSNYPFFESGNVIVSGIEQGLFVLRPNLTPQPTPTPTNTPIPTDTPTPTNTPEPGTLMHVGDLDGSSTQNGGRWNATVTITVHDDSENPVMNATVNGSWSNGANGSGSCVTDGSGQCAITKNNVKNNIANVTFTVTSVTHASNTYNPAANHDPDGDSDGTIIIVYKDGQPEPTPTPGPGVVMHIGDLDGYGVQDGNRWDAIVEILVLDANDLPVANATVSGSWSNGANGSASCTTNASGICTVTKNNIRNNASSVTFTVNDVVAAGSTYDPGANTDPDGDSDGTTIVIAHP